jgi:hypothetical protein
MGIHYRRKESPLSQSSSSLIGTHHVHFEVASRQDVEHAIILALVAPVFASLFCRKLIDRRRRLREATADLACLHGRRKCTHLL